jgi:hypothetical protein
VVGFDIVVAKDTPEIPLSTCRTDPPCFARLDPSAFGHCSYIILVSVHQHTDVRKSAERVGCGGKLKGLILIFFWRGEGGREEGDHV